MKQTDQAKKKMKQTVALCEKLREMRIQFQKNRIYNKVVLPMLWHGCFQNLKGECWN